MSAVGIFGASFHHLMAVILFSFTNIFSCQHICNKRPSSITKKSEDISLQRKYEIRTVKSSYKQYISIVATDDLKAKIEKTICAEKAVDQLNLL